MSCIYRELIKKKIPVIFDGAFGTQVQKARLTEADFGGSLGCNEILNLTRPDIVRKIHQEYLSAGANVIETNTFGANRPKLKEKGLAGKVYEVNKAGAVLARQVADQVAGGSCCVCGALGPTGFLPSSKDSALGGVSFDALADIFEEQAGALLDGGADLLLLETGQDLLEVRAALYGIRRLLKKRAKEVPLQVQVTMDADGRMLLGSDLHAFLGSAVPMGADIVGLNCGTGPVEMAAHIEKLLALTCLPVAMQPNAGMPVNAGGTAVYTMEPSAFTDVLAPLVTEKGLAVVGGCCGTTPDHIRELCRRLAGKKVAARPAAKPASRPACFCATGISGVNLESAARPVIIGERLNTQGSKKTKELVLARNWDGMGELALEQAEKGSTLLDICVAVNERDDEVDSMKTLVSFLSDRVSVPFSLDTTVPEVMEAALNVCPGSALLNSINLEKDGKRARKVLALARDFGCPVIALTIDDEGMAKTVERKLELARRLRGLACDDFGLPEHYVYIDPLVFTLATGDKENAGAAATSLEALRRVKKEMPGVRTVMGVSNVSYGFSPLARRVLNNLMLYHAAQCGLDAAIFNPLHLDDVSGYDPAARKLGEALLFNRSAAALYDFVNYFEGKGAASEKKAKPGEQLSPAEELRRAVLDRDRRAVPAALSELLEQQSASDILNLVLLPAMAEVGERMAAGIMILPFVLQAAEVMREAIAILEPHLEGAAARSKGKMVLATVFGDVHDIGKNLVGSILRNQGFEVIDLGKQVELNAIVKAVREHKPDAVGLSALLVTTSREMGECVREFARQGIAVPVIIGGAAVNRDFAERIAKLDDGSVYKGNVCYGRDAFEAAKIVERIRQGFVGVESTASPRVESAENTRASVPEPLDYGVAIHPPFYGTSVVLRWKPETLLDKIDKERLFKAWWGGGKLGQKEYEEAVKKDFTPAFDKLRAGIEKEELLEPAGLYGFFPVITDDHTIILLDPSDFHTELGSFVFPRMPKTNNRSIADYLRPEGDVLAIQVVTAGGKISGRVRDYFSKDDRYSLGYFLNGIGGYAAELLADLVTKEITRGLGLPEGTGRRYSFGYPGMPPIERQAKLFEIMAVTERLGITLTERFQMVPEHSTLGIYLHHPKAEYLV